MLAIVTAAAASACGASADGPPAIVVDRSACAHCGMLVSEPAFAAAYRVPGEAARVFDDIGCLLEAVKREPHGTRARFWFHDLRDAQWIDGARATFAASSQFRTPMGGGFGAYRDREGAERAASAQRGRVIGGLAELLSTDGGRP